MLDVLHWEIRTTRLALRCARSAARVLAAAIRVRRLLECRAGFDPAQPRDDHGRWAATASGGTLSTPVTGGSAGRDAEATSKPTEGVRVAGPFPWGLVDLRDDEAFEGATSVAPPHTLEKHVGKSDTTLVRLVRESALQAAEAGDRYRQLDPFEWSSFPSVEAANKLVNSILSREPAVVMAVAAGAMGGATFEAEFSAPVGRVAYTQSATLPVAVEDATRVRVVIRHVKEFPRGFVVHTAFPIMKFRKAP